MPDYTSPVRRPGRNRGAVECSVPVTQPQLSVIIPVYNERYTVRELVRRVVAVDVSKEIVMVDDGSTDGTSEILKSIAGRYPEVRLFQQPRNQGKGAAIRRGIQEATGEFLVIQDADLEYDPAEYPVLLEAAALGRSRRGVRVALRRRAPSRAPVLACGGEQGADAADERARRTSTSPTWRPATRRSGRI